MRQHQFATALALLALSLILAYVAATVDYAPDPQDRAAPALQDRAGEPITLPEIACHPAPGCGPR